MSNGGFIMGNEGYVRETSVFEKYVDFKLGPRGLYATIDDGYGAVKRVYPHRNSPSLKEGVAEITHLEFKANKRGIFAMGKNIEPISPNSVGGEDWRVSLMFPHKLFTAKYKDSTVYVYTTGLYSKYKMCFVESNIEKSLHAEELTCIEEVPVDYYRSILIPSFGNIFEKQIPLSREKIQIGRAMPVKVSELLDNNVITLHSIILMEPVWIESSRFGIGFCLVNESAVGNLTKEDIDTIINYNRNAVAEFMLAIGKLGMQYAVEVSNMISNHPHKKEIIELVKIKKYM